MSKAARFLVITLIILGYCSNFGRVYDARSEMEPLAKRMAGFGPYPIVHTRFSRDRMTSFAVEALKPPKGTETQNQSSWFDRLKFWDGGSKPNSVKPSPAAQKLAPAKTDDSPKESESGPLARTDDSCPKTEADYSRTYKNPFKESVAACLDLPNGLWDLYQSTKKRLTSQKAKFLKLRLMRRR